MKKSSERKKGRDEVIKFIEGLAKGLDKSAYKDDASTAHMILRETKAKFQK